MKESSTDYRANIAQRRAIASSFVTPRLAPGSSRRARVAWHGRSGWALPAHAELLTQMLAESSTAPPGSVANIPIGAKRIPLLVRILEVAVAGVGLTFAAPVMLLIAASIRIGSPGPALFRQTRLGLNGEPFQFVKFRTLYADARQQFPDLYQYRYDDNEIRKLHFHHVDDPRITREGRWLRKISLDELPNLFLVLTGKIALVGPRPQIPEMLPYYRGIMLERFSVRAGLTGLAHVSGRSNLTFYETTAIDVAYVRNRSWRLDLRILWRTLVSVIKRDGAL